MIYRTVHHPAGGRPDLGASTSFGLIASVFLAIAAIIYAGLLALLLVAALNSAPSAWHSMPSLAFLTAGAAITCASAGLLFLATVPFRAAAHFWEAGSALSRGEAPERMNLGTWYGLAAVAAIFAVASVLPILDGEYARQPWTSVAFQMTLLGAPSVLAVIALRAEAVMRRDPLQRQGADTE